MNYLAGKSVDWEIRWRPKELLWRIEETGVFLIILITDAKHVRLIWKYVHVLLQSDRDDNAHERKAIHSISLALKSTKKNMFKLLGKE
ncbi:hypothetical protein [Dubosiella newyorkensis]|uniref:hypothetical protein n=1 Tax=Dubosiella newyorkensis TaxID=1862672 RepID=UPI003F668BE6